MTEELIKMGKNPLGSEIKISAVEIDKIVTDGMSRTFIKNKINKELTASGYTYIEKFPDKGNSRERLLFTRIYSRIEEEKKEEKKIEPVIHPDDMSTILDRLENVEKKTNAVLKYSLKQAKEKKDTEWVNIFAIMDNYILNFGK